MFNGFQNRCVRTIVGIAPSYVSRVSNAAVLAKNRYTNATDLLKKKRLQLFGKILGAPEGHLLRVASFIPNTTAPATECFVRRVGRPSKEWIREVTLEAIAVFGSLDAAISSAAQKVVWDNILCQKMCF